MHKKNILIFEPWNLGDLIIAAESAKQLAMLNFKISFICDPKWSEWLNSLSFVENIIEFHIPWTEKVKKYDLRKYNIKEILHLRKEVKKNKPDYIWDSRGDIRNYLFLSFLLQKKIVSFWNKKNINVYRRIDYFIKYLGIENNKSGLSNKKRKIKNIICFFGAYWKNRRVPLDVAYILVEHILEMEYNISIILQPDDSKDKWQFIFEKYPSKIFLIKDDILTVSSKMCQADLCISTDSAFLHMAYFYNVPTIGLFASLNADQWAPPNCKVIYADKPIPAKLRYNFKYENIQPLKNLSISDVIKSIKSFD